MTCTGTVCFWGWDAGPNLAQVMSKILKEEIVIFLLGIHHLGEVQRLFAV